MITHSLLRHARALLPLTALWGLTATAPAQTLGVDWGGNYVTANENFATNGSGLTGGFTAGDPIQINPSSGYSGTSAAFYGMLETYSDAGTPSNNLGVVGNAASDLLVLKASNNVDNTGFLVLWEQSGFLNGLDTGLIAFDATSTFRLNMTTYAGQDATDSGRIVLRLNDGNYYISERTFIAGGDQSRSPLTLDYFTYDPATELNPSAQTLTAAPIISGDLITGITEIGFYFESNDANDAVRIQDFEAAFVVVPEPSGALLLVLGGAVFFMRRRRC